MDHKDDHEDQASKNPKNDQGQAHEQIFPFASLQSESESDNDYDYDREDYEFFETVGFESELGFLEEQYSDDEDDDEMDEDDEDGIDVDELTYEELIALGEFIGVQERGLSSKEISSCLRPVVSKTTSEIRERSDGVVDRCVICQIEYEDGEALVALHCEHSYHSDCITKWLQIKKCCPICATEISSSSTSINNNNNNNINNNKDS